MLILGPSKPSVSPVAHGAGDGHPDPSPEAYFKVDTYALVTVEIQSWSEPVVHGGGGEGGGQHWQHLCTMRWARKFFYSGHPSRPNQLGAL